MRSRPSSSAALGAAEPTLRAALSSTRWLMVPGRQQEAASLAPRRPRSRVARFLSQPDRDDP